MAAPTNYDHDHHHQAPTTRAEFLDHDHPLKTNDPKAQKLVSEHIRTAMKGPRLRVKPGADVVMADGTVATLGDFVAPRGTRPEVSQTDIAVAFNEDAFEVKELSRHDVAKLIDHPEDMTVRQVQALCLRLCVKVETLRYGEESDITMPGADVIAEVYDAMGQEDRDLVYRVMSRITDELAFAKARKRAERSGMVRL